jgi:hypothetical protein
MSLWCTNAKCSDKGHCKRFIAKTRDTHIVTKPKGDECPYYIKKRKKNA